MGGSKERWVGATGWVDGSVFGVQDWMVAASVRSALLTLPSAGLRLPPPLPLSSPFAFLHHAAE